MHILKKYKGFTLVELVIVIVIVGILSVISVPIYRGYVQKAKMTEGQILVNGLVKAQLAYHTKHGYFYDCGGYVNSDKNIDMDARGNKYFTEFDCWVNGDSGDAPAEASKTLEKVNKTTFSGGSWGNDGNDNVLVIAKYIDNNGQIYTVSTKVYANGSKTEMVTSSGSEYPSGYDDGGGPIDGPIGEGGGPTIYLK
ncbi:prepilin-type N-terminal cleavage/methylation domain-containing protein [Candidatus Ruminimicrobiellum ovillum]|uniref:prepilin-type N-terminal cleavage/methylation domain-containing protein n=1 Tax=Candidatus Ruminimicrobiellum ovillum TaxID=1947927 RepID=UPI003559A3BE